MNTLYTILFSTPVGIHRPRVCSRPILLEDVEELDPVVGRLVLSENDLLECRIERLPVHVCNAMLLGKIFSIIPR